MTGPPGEPGVYPVQAAARAGASRAGGLGACGLPPPVLPAAGQLVACLVTKRDSSTELAQ